MKIQIHCTNLQNINRIHAEEWWRLRVVNGVSTGRATRVSDKNHDLHNAFTEDYCQYNTPPYLHQYQELSFYQFHSNNVLELANTFLQKNTRFYHTQ